MLAAIIYKKKIITDKTHCGAYIKLEEQLGRPITTKELKKIKSVYIKDEAREIKLT